MSGKFIQVASEITQNRMEYGERHDIPVHIVLGRVDKSTAPIWDRHLVAIDLLNRYKWVFWMDADMVFLKMCMDLRDFIGDTDKQIIMSSAVAGDDYYFFNCGGMFLRSSEWTKGLLRRWRKHGISANMTKDQPVLHGMMGSNDGIVPNIDFRNPSPFNGLYRYIGNEPYKPFVVHYNNMPFHQQVANVLWATKNPIREEE